jgi:hypothetical protein
MKSLSEDFFGGFQVLPVSLVASNAIPVFPQQN